MKKSIHGTGAVLLCAVGLAAPAAGQCIFDVPLVPDFDQRRDNALPGDGSMYCVPTSVTNWFAYFANRGLPQPAALDGPRNWQLNANYNVATSAIGGMGVLMQTSATGGTSGGNGLAGAQLFSAAFAQGKVAVVRFACGDGYCPTPLRMAVARILGGHISPCYGHYTQSQAGFYTRNGGHCITMVGLDGCASPATLRFRDPASDSNNTTQSPFLTHSAVMTQTVAFFRGSSTANYELATRWRLNYGTDKFLDSWYVLTPLFALTAHPDYSLVHLVRPASFYNGLPPMQAFPAPANGMDLSAVAMHPQLTSFYMATEAPAGGAGRLYEFDARGAAPRELLPGNFHLMGFNRHGELYVCEGQRISRYDVEASPPALLNSLLLPATPDALDFDDETDTIGLILPTAVQTRKQFVRLPRNLLAPLPGGGLLPGNAGSVPGEVSLRFDPATQGRLFVMGSGAPRFHVLMAGTGGLGYVFGVELPQGTEPSAGAVDDRGHVLFISGGVMHEWMQGAAGGWGPDPQSIFAGKAAAGWLLPARSRTNHDPALHEGPSWQDLPNPDVIPGVPDCYANCDGSTVAPTLNVQDFTCFLQKYAAGDPDANCDFSRVPPVLNVADFSCFLQEYARGCP